MIDENQKYLGWFDNDSQTEPAYNPPINGPCIVCDEPLHPPIKSISLMPIEGAADGRSYFYRVHRACYEAAPKAADEMAMNMIEGRRN